MANLTIRNAPDEVRERLRAARDGRSMESEIRAVLNQVTPAENRRATTDALQAQVNDLYGSNKPCKDLPEPASKCVYAASASAIRVMCSRSAQG